MKINELNSTTNNYFESTIQQHNNQQKFTQISILDDATISDLMKNTANNDTLEQASKIQSLKQEVLSGSYSRPVYEVANKFFHEVFNVA